MRTRPLKVALLGCGVVGSEVARIMTTHADDLAARIGAPVELAGVAVRRPDKVREGIDPALITTDATALVKRGDLDVVVEVIGGIEPARTLITTAFEHGASVVSANKALLAQDGAALHAAAEEHGKDLYYEAAVAGAIPLIRPLRESLAGDKVNRVLGIVNGTTNSTSQDGLDRGRLSGGPRRGHRARVRRGRPDRRRRRLRRRRQGRHPRRDRLPHARAPRRRPPRGHDRGDGRGLRLRQGNGLHHQAARHLRAGRGRRVRHRARAPGDDPAQPPAGLRARRYNAVFVESDASGRLMFYGPGAGGSPTASAVLGDLVAVARNRINGTTGPGESAYAALPVSPMGEVVTRYHISLDVADKPGVLAQVATVFAEHGVSIDTVRQQGKDGEASLVVVTHRASDAALGGTVEALRKLDTVRGVASIMRVEGE
ncbi:Homoserine dehydrogenase OS=Streptomyces albaduncus OX=68172 GN=FHS32_004733 PE=3 SV=1 [Streptomyces griseoloalbus]